jgi:hypothetical protein
VRSPSQLSLARATCHNAPIGRRVMTEYKIAKNTERHDSMSGASHRT